MTTPPITTIRFLIDLRRIANQRNENVEAASEARDDTSDQWAFASRVWSRQSQALMRAIISEPPTNLIDALSVLACLAEMREMHPRHEEDTAGHGGDIAEMTDVAIHNCVVAMADAVGSSAHASDYAWIGRQVSRWLPTSRPWEAAWQTAMQSYETALSAEDHHFSTEWRAAEEAGTLTSDDPTGVEAEHMRLQDVRIATEEALISTPAPSLIEANWKIAFSRERWAEATEWPVAWWDAITADLNRFERGA